MINSELIKEAIADARAVRTTAVLNAKHALEEAFAPTFQAMFAEKLREEAADEETEPVQEVSAPKQVHASGGEAKGPKTKDVSKGQPKKVSDANTNWKVVGIGGKAAAKDAGVPVADNKIEENADEPEAMANAGETEEVGVTTEDLEEIIKELESEVANSENPEGETPEAGQAPVAAPSPAGAPGEEPAPSPAPEAPGCEAPAAEGEQEVDVAAPAAPEEEAPAPTTECGTECGMEDETINLESLLEALNDEEEGKGKEDEEVEGEEKVDESVATEHGLPKNVGGQDKSGGKEGYPKAPHDASKKQVTTGKNAGGHIGKGAVNEVESLRNQNKQLQESLTEHTKAIRYLQEQINEVNLLNAKLLYTTKLFKEFNLDNKQKMRVVETFDLLKNVREVKLTFTGMCEALNFGAGKKKAGQKTAAAGRITESYAAKPVASTKPAAEIISDSNEMANRFKKLAGIE